MSLLDKMTKEQLIQAVKDYGCGKLRTLPLDCMTKQQIIEHLKACQCPLLHKLMTKQI